MVCNLQICFKTALNAIYNGNNQLVIAILICIACITSPGISYAEPQPFTTDDIKNVISGPPYPDNKSYTPELIQLMDINGDAQTDINDLIAFQNAKDRDGDGKVTLDEAIASQVNPNPTPVQDTKMAGRWLVSANFKSKNVQVPTVSFAFVLDFDAASRTATVINMPATNPNQPLVKQVNVDTTTKQLKKRTNVYSPSKLLQVGRKFQQVGGEGTTGDWELVDTVDKDSEITVAGFKVTKTWELSIDKAAVLSEKTEQGTITEQTIVADSNLGPISRIGTIRLTSLNE